MSYLPRIVDKHLRWLLTGFRAVLINGARGVGKSTTAAEVARTVYNLDDPTTLGDVTDDPYLLVRSPKPTLIDEWQRYPESMNLIKNAVDKGTEPGQFILTGTPSHNLGPSIQSGAGRMAVLSMRPLSLAERNLETPTVSLTDLLSDEICHIGGESQVSRDDYADIILASGFPETQSMAHDFIVHYLDGYIELLLRHDLPHHMQTQRQRLPAAALREWLASYSQAISTHSYFKNIAKIMEVREGGTPSDKTIRAYADGIQDLGILDPLPHWPETYHHIERLYPRDKHHLVDPALGALLCGIRRPHILRTTWRAGQIRRESTGGGQHLFGALFESLVTQSVRAYAEACQADAYWLGTQKGGNRREREIDVIVQDANQQIVAIEVKLNDRVDDSDVRHLRWLRGEMGGRWADGVVVYTGSRAYRRDDGIAVVPASLLGQ